MKKRTHKLISKHNYHITRHKGFKRYINFLLKYLNSFSVQYKQENKVDSFTNWIDIYEKGVWNIKRTKEIKRCFRNETQLGCFNEMQPECVAIYKTNVKVLIAFKMNYKWELEQRDNEDYKEYTFIYIMLNKGITELLKGSDNILKD